MANNIKKHQITQEGLDNLNKEYRELIEVKRPANTKALQEAREQGDLSENADYDAAKTEQAEIEKTYKNTNSNFFRFKSFIFIEKEDKIIIKYIPNENKENGAKELREAFLEFLEYKRKKEQ